MNGVVFDKRPNGKWRARWYDSSGKRVSFSTGQTLRSEAGRKAAEEMARRQGTSIAAPPPALPSTTPGHLSGGIPPTTDAHVRRFAGEAIARVLQPLPAPGLASPAPVTDAAQVPPPDDDGGDVAKIKRMHEVLGKRAARIVDAALDGGCRFFGREPAETDDDDLQIIAEGATELSGIYFGKKKLTPWGKVFMGAGVAGALKFIGGTPIPKPPKPPLHLVPPGAKPQQQQQPDAPEGDGGRGG